MNEWFVCEKCGNNSFELNKNQWFRCADCGAEYFMTIEWYQTFIEKGGDEDG